MKRRISAMQISEKDIFLYFKYPDQLIPEKKKYIDEHPDEFSMELEFLKSFDATEVDSGQLQPFQIVYLNKREKKQKSTENNFRLAAANHLTEIIDDAETFIDPNGEFIAKLITVDSERRIYIFDNLGNTLKDFSIRIKPGNTSYKMEIYSDYLRIPNDILIEGLEIHS